MFLIFGTNLSFGAFRLSTDFSLVFPFYFRRRSSLFFGFDRKESVKATLLLAVEILLELVRTFSHAFLAVQQSVSAREKIVGRKDLPEPLFFD